MKYKLVLNCLANGKMLVTIRCWSGMKLLWFCITHRTQWTWRIQWRTKCGDPFRRLLRGRHCNRGAFPYGRLDAEVKKNDLKRHRGPGATHRPNMDPMEQL